MNSYWQLIESNPIWYAALVGALIYCCAELRDRRKSNRAHEKHKVKHDV